MSEAARLRAQKAYSTDPEYLERMALAEEAREKARLTGREATPADAINRRIPEGE